MKRYLLFANVSYYPEGGWNDFRASFETVEAACSEGERFVASDELDAGDWWHVVDTVAGGITHYGKRKY